MKHFISYWIAAVLLLKTQVLDFLLRRKKVGGKLRLEVYKDKKNEYRWRLIGANNKIVAVSSESYKTKYGLTKTIRNIRKHL